MAAALFATAAVIGFQVSFIGLAIGFALLPLMHSLGWSNRFVRVLVWIPFSLVVAGMGVGALGMAGLAPVFFGFGFHF